MIWILVIVIVIIIYNAEKWSGIIDNLKKEVPHIVETSKKVSKELKEKAHAAAEKKSSNNKKDKK
ncbi:MAG: hypothetical protein J6W96_05155 [Alphaproteobacteria bacterium]|nr:hypothetical protein [Alphaproteobacteria bacterium]